MVQRERRRRGLARAVSTGMPLTASRTNFWTQARDCLDWMLQGGQAAGEVRGSRREWRVHLKGLRGAVQGGRCRRQRRRPPAATPLLQRAAWIPWRIKPTCW